MTMVKVTSVSSVLCGLSALSLLYLNGRGPATLLLQGAELFSVTSVVLGFTALLSGFWHIDRSRRELRRPAAILAILTTVVLMAHLYVINSPPTATGSSVSGVVGIPFGDTRILVSSQLSADILTVRLTNAGSNANNTLNAIGGVALYLGGVQLSSSDLRPDPSYQNPLQPLSASSLNFPSSASGIWRINSSSDQVLTVNYQYLTCYHVPTSSDPRGVFGCIMDETYYVPSALGLISGEQCAPYADNCNLEHPPLAKSMIAAGIAAFGLNDFGYRISEVILGTLTIPLIFVLVELLGGGRRLSYFATFVFAADPLFFVHSSAAIIDVPAIFFSILGFIFYLRRGRLWKINNYVASGVFFGLALLSKETSVFALLAVITFESLFGESGARASLRRIAQMALPAAILFAVALQAFDSVYASGALQWFYQQVQFMFTYGASLRGGGWCLFGSTCPNGPYIAPLNWLTFTPPIGYLVVSASSALGSYVAVGYYGVANPAIVWMVYLWLPVTLYPILKERRWRSALAGERRLGAFLVVWFIMSYVPYVALWVYGRVTYPFYVLPAVPALSIGAAWFITRGFFPRKMAVIYVMALFAIFFLFFPVKDFLPIPVRVLLGR